MDLVTNKRTLQTVVMVDDGDILVLGGLIDDNVQQTEQKIPLLGGHPGARRAVPLDQRAEVQAEPDDLHQADDPARPRHGQLSTPRASTTACGRCNTTPTRKATRLLWRDKGPMLDPLSQMLNTTRPATPAANQPLDLSTGAPGRAGPPAAAQNEAPAGRGATQSPGAGAYSPSPAVPDAAAAREADARPLQFDNPPQRPRAGNPAHHRPRR